MRIHETTITNPHDQGNRLVVKDNAYLPGGEGDKLVIRVIEDGGPHADAEAFVLLDETFRVPLANALRAVGSGGVVDLTLTDEDDTLYVTGNNESVEFRIETDEDSVGIVLSEQEVQRIILALDGEYANPVGAIPLGAPAETVAPDTERTDAVTPANVDGPDPRVEWNTTAVEQAAKLGLGIEFTDSGYDDSDNALSNIEVMASEKHGTVVIGDDENLGVLRALPIAEVDGYVRAT